MTGGNIPEEVVRFLELNIETVPHLEALLLMRTSAPAEWDAQRIAARVYVTFEVAASILEDLERRGMLERKQTGFAYADRWERAHSEMHLLEASYRTALVPLSKLIHAKATGSLRDFARAFRLKSDR